MDNTKLRDENISLSSQLQEALDDKKAAQDYAEKFIRWFNAAWAVWDGVKEDTDKFRDQYVSWTRRVADFHDQVVAVTKQWTDQLGPLASRPRQLLAMRPTDYPFHDGSRTCKSWTDVVVSSVFGDTLLWQTMPGIDKPYSHDLVSLRATLGTDNTDVGDLHGVWYELRNISKVRGGGKIHEQWANIADRKLVEATNYIRNAVTVVSVIVETKWPTLEKPPRFMDHLPELPPTPE